MDRDRREVWVFKATVENGFKFPSPVGDEGNMALLGHRLLRLIVAKCGGGRTD